MTFSANPIALFLRDVFGLKFLANPEFRIADGVNMLITDRTLDVFGAIATYLSKLGVLLVYTPRN